MKDDLSRYLRLAASEEIVITRHGRPAGVLIGFESEEDWFEYRLGHHPEFLERIREARRAIAAGRGVRLEDLAEYSKGRSDQRMQQTKRVDVKGPTRQGGSPES